MGSAMIMVVLGMYDSSIVISCPFVAAVLALGRLGVGVDGEYILHSFACRCSCEIVSMTRMQKET
jgi:hypothetical protein